MKKFVRFVLCITVCLSLAAALAMSAYASTPSKSTRDIGGDIDVDVDKPVKPVEQTEVFDIEVVDAPEGSGFFVRDIKEEEREAFEKRLEARDIEFEKLDKEEKVVNYFGVVTDNEGNPVDLNMMLETEDLAVFDYFPLLAGSYVEEYGEVKLNVLLETPYKDGQDVAVMIGIVTIHEDGTQTVEWKVYEGVGIETEYKDEEKRGCIQVKLDPEIVEHIQDDLTLMAVVSDPNDFFFVRDVKEDEEEYKVRLDANNVEIKKLAESKSVESYFGTVTYKDGTVVDMKKILGVDELNVFEFFPLIAGSYEELFGTVKLNVLLATPYEPGQHLIVMIGFVTFHLDGTQTVEWTAYDGIGIEVNSDDIEKQGAIQVELDPETVLAIQNGVALMAIISA